MEVTCKDLQRFWNKVEKSNNCWEWIAGKTKNGYGIFRLDKKIIYSHKFSYEIFNGEVPQELEIDHLCRNRACVNPEHLEAVTHKENSLRGINPLAINARKTHCIHGHEFTEENTAIRRTGSRRCRICTNNFNKNHHKKEMK